ncbi:hypothetical protein AQUCO_00400681v1 [Aquilegia coerulea]|uniref:PB1-like domain-containing protein n=1 Tax=Aquilegia coerulea TaxID=218851 RepID=A0A2G5EW29_AQUCA|nr:hypothetical protein AQUCO_00400681v1 [Aquilegia coerulea]
MQEIVFEVHHGGFFSLIPSMHYKMGKKDYFALDVDKLGAVEIKSYIEDDLKYRDVSKIHWCVAGRPLKDNLRLVVDDRSTVDMMNVVQSKELIELYVEHDLFDEVFWDFGESSQPNKPEEHGDNVVYENDEDNNQMYPFAWAVVTVENKENWKWFLEHLMVPPAPNTGKQKAAQVPQAPAPNTGKKKAAQVPQAPTPNTGKKKAAQVPETSKSKATTTTSGLAAKLATTSRAGVRFSIRKATEAGSSVGGSKKTDGGNKTLGRKPNFVDSWLLVRKQT